MKSIGIFILTKALKLQLIMNPTSSSKMSAQRLRGNIARHPTTRKLFLCRGYNQVASSKSFGMSVNHQEACTAPTWQYYRYGCPPYESYSNQHQQRHHFRSKSIFLRRSFSSNNNNNGHFGDFPWDNAHHQKPTNHPHLGPRTQPLVTTTSADSNAASQELLDQAAAEGRRIFDRTRASATGTTAAPASNASSSLARQEHLKHNPAGDGSHAALLLLEEEAKMKELEDAADSLLAATKLTISLARVITYSPNNDNRVHLLHRAFLSIIQKCVSALIQGATSKALADATKEWPSSLSSSSSSSRKRQSSSSSSSSSTPLFSSESEPPLLDKTLRLAVRARGDLGLPLHLPLYQMLALSVAQSSQSSSTIAKWIIQAGKWAQADFGPESISASMTTTSQYHDDDDDHDHHHNYATNQREEFFARPLCHLAQRKRFSDLVDVLLLILHSKDFVSMAHLSQSTLQGILGVLYEDLRTLVWEPNHRKQKKQQASSIRRRFSSHQQSQSMISKDTLALEEVLLLLEPSIWKVFGYSSLAPEQTTSLREAIDVLLSPSWNIKNGSSDSDLLPSSGKTSFPAVLPDNPELLQALFPEEDFPDHFPFPESDEDEYYTNETSDHLTSGSATWEFRLDMDSDLARRVFPIDEDDDDDDDWDDEDGNPLLSDGFCADELYNRSDLLRDLPDVVHQIEQVTGKPLTYSKRLEQDLLQQLNDPHQDFD